MAFKKLKKSWNCCLGTMTRTELKCWKCGAEAPEIVIRRIKARKAIRDFMGLTDEI